MKEALIEAKKALVKNEVPIGAVIVKDNNIIGRGHNSRETLNDATAHAEILAIKEACKSLNNWRLTDCDMYVTLEPCLMCSGAIINSRIKNLYIGTTDSKVGATSSIMDIFSTHGINHKVNVDFSYLNDECSNLIKSFFSTLRK